LEVFEILAKPLAFILGETVLLIFQIPAS